jgi:signal recognition particle subunit SRP54
VPADVYRPAAIEQLAILGKQIDCGVHPSHEGADPVAVSRDAMIFAKNHGHDILLIDTAGRLHIDDELMDELQRLKGAINPHHIVLVVDAMTGQDAVNVASGFHGRLGVTGAPVLFAGTGEKLDALELFHPDRMATRILGMGDVLTLVEKVERAYDAKQAVALQKKLRRNEFTLDDFRDQLRTVRKMGSMGDLLGMIPGMKKLTKGLDVGSAETELKRIEAIIGSMTNEERRNHLILNGSRRQRIALGSGTSVAEVNRFLKQFVQTKKVMKQMSKFAGRGMPQGMSM